MFILIFITPMPGPADMKDEDFKGIVAGLNDAIAFAQGDTTKGRIADRPDVKAVRAKAKLSQATVANKLQAPVGTNRSR